MMVQKSIKRIITCQGSIQLVAAIAALRQREKEQQDSQINYENYLVIYDLYSPPGQIEQFAEFIQQMAELIDSWKQVTYFTPEQLKQTSSDLNFSSPAAIFNRIYQFIGTTTTDEIYLSRNWQFGNQLFINAYSTATKICYGDGVGIYISPTSTAFFPVIRDRVQKSSILKTLKMKVEEKVKSVFEKSREILKLKTVLKTIEFNSGYFVLPEIFGETPSMPYVVIEPSRVLNIFQSLKSLVSHTYIQQFQEVIDGSAVDILLTSNLSEAERMSEDDEISAYRKFLLNSSIKQNTVLVIKPHPRDGQNKLETLKDSLSDLFSNVLVLSEPDLFFLPFEVFFAEAILPSNASSRKLIRIFAVSSACISLKLLFDLPSHIGFGEDVTPQFFYKNYVDGRVAHELQLKAAIQNIATTCISAQESET